MSGALRWATSLKGGGVLTFAPALLLDSYGVIETDLQTGSRHFNGKKFLVSQARSQSGNAVVLVGLVGGIFFQVVWNWSGAADATAEAVERALR